MMGIISPYAAWPVLGPIVIGCVPPTVTAQQKRVRIMGGKPMFFHSQAQISALNTFTSFLMPHQPEAPILGPVKLDVSIIWPYTKGDLARKVDACREDFIPHATKPDLDNVVKAFIDTLAGLRFIENDSRIWELHISKFRGPHPGIRFAIYNLAT